MSAASVLAPDDNDSIRRGILILRKKLCSLILPPGKNRRTLVPALFRGAEEQGRKKRKPASEETGDESYQQRRDDRSFPDAVKTMGKDQGEGGGDDSQRHIKGDFCRAKLCLPCRRNSADKGFSRKHCHVCKDFRIHAKSQDQASDQKIGYRRNIALRVDEKEQHHRQVDEIPEQDGNWDLEQMLHLKVPAQDEELDKNQQKAECDRELPQRKRKVQAEHIRDR